MPDPTPVLDDPLDAAAVRAALGADARAFDLGIVATCASTNSLLLDAPSRADDLIPVLCCEYQTAGRGRRGRRWESAPGTGLTFSLRRCFGVPPARLSGLSLAVGLAVVQALEARGVAGLALKWPNDVLLHGGKLAGILIDLQADGAGETAAVIGIGLNVHGVPADIEVAQATLAPAALDTALVVPSRNVLLADLLRHLRDTLDVFAHHGFGALREPWLARHAWQRRQVCVRRDAAKDIVGECIGIDVDGALLVYADGSVQRILGGDVSLRTQV